MKQRKSKGVIWSDYLSTSVVIKKFALCVRTVVQSKLLSALILGPAEMYQFDITLCYVDTLILTFRMSCRPDS